MTDYLWVDLEMTGLDHKNCRIVEIACLLTRDNLVPYSSFESIVYQNPHVGWEQVAKEMHQKNGLFDLIKTGRHERVVVNELVQWLKSHIDRRLVNLAGNSVHFDRRFLEEQWPEIRPFLSHRHLDVSSFKIYAEGQGIKRFGKQPTTHRAMDDIKHSIKEFKYYLSEIKKLKKPS